MNKIENTVNNFKQSILDKHAYIKEMYHSHHSKLFDYSQYLKNTNIKKIEIEDSGVVLTTRDHGIKMICPEGDYRTALIESLNFSEYEKNDSEMILNLINDGDCFFDVGANMGWYSILVGALKRSVSIYSFEPLPKTYSYFQKNINLNSVLNISSHEFGFSNKTGEFSFYYYPEGSGNASAENVTDRQDVEVVTCKLATLDNFVNKNKLSVDFIKCDVEGGELLAFQGGKASIERDLPIVFSEILRKWTKKFDYNPNDIFNFFYELGYKSFVTNNDSLVEFGLMDENTIETNFFFLHDQKHNDIIKKYSRS